jgi:hypothetical protein
MGDQGVAGRRASLARKLYFDVDITGGSSVTFALTPEFATTPGDRWGGLLAPLPACDGNSNAKIKRAGEITAIFAPNAGTSTLPPRTDFLQGRLDTTPGAVAPFFTAGATGTAVVPGKAGRSAVFVHNPRFKLFSTTITSGILYIQRQHSIEV